MYSAKGVGHRIRELRIDRGLTLDDMRQRTGISSASLSRLERGIYSMSVDDLMAIARALDVSPSSLLGALSSPVEVECPHCGGKGSIRV